MVSFIICCHSYCGTMLSYWVEAAILRRAMKKSVLKRKTPLRRKPFPKNGRGFLQPDPIRAQVQRRKEELARRRKLKRELLAECSRDGDVILCPRCKKRPDFRGLQLIHIKSLGSGGKTTRLNCEILCAPCHFGFGPGGHRTEGRQKIEGGNLLK